MRCVRYLFAALFLAWAGAAQADHDSTVGIRCKDGTMVKAGRDACSYNGGMVKEEGAPVPTKTTPASVDSDEDKRVAPSTPATGSPAQVRCKDGTLALVERGACSRNGGIDKPTAAAPMAVPGSTPDRPAEKEAKVHAPKAELTATPPAVGLDPHRPTARCKDGTLAYAMHHSATCSGHGGIDEWTDAGRQ